MGLDVTLVRCEDRRRYFHFPRAEQRDREALRKRLIPDLMKGAGIERSREDMTEDERSRLDRWTNPTSVSITWPGATECRPPTEHIDREWYNEPLVTRNRGSYANGNENPDRSSG